MSTFLYVRTELDVPGVGSAIHLAELEELSASECRLHRLLALAPNESVVGAATPHASHGGADIPQERVPHPNAYADYPNISASYIEPTEFEGLWSEAAAQFPGLS
ncbi:hypothetical protein G7Y31_11750 [Corynebacterium lizhenjunii]|uniref:Uncharacterized protein n=1 Tax=Corynebacterium lizhenjunii TaxID=2709394 RepID=A0A7T0KFR2_9CORY|nr:hypothetical protein [Corynebacterium lizhenjunii]QPK79144.1 hypothetical protein G7Y31_11750 [Corynebacterium lizhenjunii]